MSRTSVAASAIRSTFVILTLGLALAVAPRSVVRAESTITVTTDADTVAADGFCSLREAIQAANTDLPVNECIAGSGADRIVFSADGTIILSSTLYVNSAMTIDGAGLAVALSGNDAVRVLYVLSGGDLTLKQLTVQDGWGGSGQGAGIYNAGTLTVLSSTVAQNATDSSGSAGGLYNNGTATVIDSTFSGNAGGFGGAIYTTSGSTLTTILNCAIVNNHAAAGSGGGGGMLAQSVVTVANSTFSGNTTANGGGGILSWAALTLTHNTFLGNAEHIRNFGTFYMAGNLLGPTSGGSACNSGGTMVDNGYNLAADASCGFTAPTSQNSATFDLGALAGNGGPTATHRLNPGSAGVDAIPLDTTVANNGVSYTCGQNGEPLDGDQRGVARPQGTACDAGAFEAEAYTLTVTSLHGTVVKDPDQATYHEGDVVELTATPDAGSDFAGWTGDVTASENPVSVAMHGDTVITANYLPLYTLTVVSEHGTVQKDPDQATYFGDDLVQLTATPDVGWVFTGWTGDIYGSDNPALFRVYGDMVITANYVKEIYTPTFRSAGAYDGWILESAESRNAGGTFDKTAATLRLGDEAADKQYRAILSFDTSTLPDDAVITNVTLKIKKQGQVGANPFTLLGGLKVDMRQPYFGTAPGLAPGDFQALAGKTAVATFGATPVGNWYSAALGSVGRAYVNKSGTTQFRLRFATDDNDDNGADYMRFYSGNAAASVRPVLVVEYSVP